MLPLYEAQCPRSHEVGSALDPMPPSSKPYVITAMATEDSNFGLHFVVDFKLSFNDSQNPRLLEEAACMGVDPAALIK